MLGWFAPRCPVDPATRAWADDRFSWLLQRLGSTAIAAANVTPESLQLQQLDGSETAVEALFDRICQRMEVDRNRVVLSVYEAEHRPGLIRPAERQRLEWSGLYGGNAGERATIWIDANLLSLPQTLVATMAHELAHERLLGERHLSNDVLDHELMTDLTTTVCGFGLFGAADSLHSEYRINRRGSSLHRMGYLPTPAWCWGLALRSWIRGDDGSECLQWSPAAVRRIFRRALRFLQHDAQTYVPPTTFLADDERLSLCRQFAPQATQMAVEIDEEHAILQAVASADDPAAVTDAASTDVSSVDLPGISRNDEKSTDEASVDDQFPHETDQTDETDDHTEMETEDGGLSTETTVLLLEAHALAMNEDHQSAIDLLDRVVELEPDNEVAFQQRALSHIEMGLHRLAMEDGIRAAELEPDDLKSLFARGAAFIKCGRHEEGKADLRHCINATIGQSTTALIFRSRASWLIGQAEQEQHDSAAAEQSFRDAIRYWGDWPEPHEALADVYEALGRFAQAEAARNEAQRRQQD